MAMTNAPATARVRVAVPGDDATLERAAQQLRAELLDLDVESVHRATVGDAPPGAKAVEAIELGTLLVTLVTSGALLEQVVGLLRSWVSRDRERAVILEIGDAKLQLDHASPEQQLQLIQTWIAHVRHRSGESDQPGLSTA